MDFRHTELKSPDEVIVRALISRDPVVTREFFYRKCYPLFKSIYDRYHTDCQSLLEFINEIYLHILTPDKETGISRLENFGFRSTLFTWLKTVTLCYCYKRYERTSRMPVDSFFENSDDMGVRIPESSESIESEEFHLAAQDAETILNLMPNRRYSLLIRFRYLEEHSNEETAAMMGMNMNTFYNKHKLAKEQFVKTLRKEENYYD